MAEAGGEMDEIMVTVMVTDVDENVAPEFPGTEDGVSQRGGDTQQRAEDIGNPVEATDANNDVLTTPWAGPMPRPST